MNETNEAAMIESLSSSSRSRTSSVSSSSTSKTKRKSTSLPSETVDYLKNWMMSPEHIAHPYPTEQEKAEIMQDTGIELKQLTNWFVNNRKRFWKPRVEAKLQKQSSDVITRGKPLFEPARTLPPPPPTVSASSTLANVVSSINFRQMLEPSAEHDPALSMIVTPQPSPARAKTNVTMTTELPILIVNTMSDQGSVASVTEDESSSSSDDNTIVVSETIDIFVVRPLADGEQPPTLQDVVTAASAADISSDRILRSFYGCPLSYRLPSDWNDRKGVQLRCNAEVLRAKKVYLKVYLQEVHDEAAAAAAAAVTVLAAAAPKVSLKRSLVQDDDDVTATTPRPKYRRVSLELWQKACQSAKDGYDQALPSLEEATQLFGFAK